MNTLTSYRGFQFNQELKTWLYGLKDFGIGVYTENGTWSYTIVLGNMTVNTVKFATKEEAMDCGLNQFNFLTGK